LRGSVFILSCNAVLFGIAFICVAFWGLHSAPTILTMVAFGLSALFSALAALKEGRRQDA
jgi:hypothetical protein